MKRFRASPDYYELVTPPLHHVGGRDHHAADVAVAALVAARGGGLHAHQALPRLSLRERPPHAGAHADRDRQRRGVDAAADAGVDAGPQVGPHVRERPREPAAPARAGRSRDRLRRAAHGAQADGEPAGDEHVGRPGDRRRQTGCRANIAAARDAQLGSDGHVRHLLHAQHLLARAVGDERGRQHDVDAGTATPLGKEIDPKKAFDRLFAGSDTGASAVEAEQAANAPQERARFGGRARRLVAQGEAQPRRRAKVDELFTGIRALEQELQTKPVTRDVHAARGARDRPRFRQAARLHAHADGDRVPVRRHARHHVHDERRAQQSKPVVHPRGRGAGGDRFGRSLGFAPHRERDAGREVPGDGAVEDEQDCRVPAQAQDDHRRRRPADAEQHAGLDQQRDRGRQPPQPRRQADPARGAAGRPGDAGSPRSLSRPAATTRWSRRTATSSSPCSAFTTSGSRPSATTGRRRSHGTANQGSRGDRGRGVRDRARGAMAASVVREAPGTTGNGDGDGERDGNRNRDAGTQPASAARAPERPGSRAAASSPRPRRRASSSCGASTTANTTTRSRSCWGRRWRRRTDSPPTISGASSTPSDRR